MNDDEIADEVVRQSNQGWRWAALIVALILGTQLAVAFMWFDDNRQERQLELERDKLDPRRVIEQMPPFDIRQQRRWP